MFFRRKVRYSANAIVMTYADPERAIRWWTQVFDCERAELPEWDDPLPNDAALRLPGDPEPEILISARADVEQAGLKQTNVRAILFCDRLEAAFADCRKRNAQPGPIQSSRGPKYFELRDPENNIVEVCEEV